MKEPVRIVPIPCPFGRGSTIYVYYIDAPKPTLIDTGVAASPARVIEPALAAAGFRLQDVRWILATHGHWDHIGGAHATRERVGNGVTLALHHEDQSLLRERAAHVRGYYGMRFRYLDDPQALAQSDAMLMENISGELAADRELADDDRLDLGGGISIRVVHTPGHSAGSASYLLERDSRAFVGDAVQVHGSSGNRFPLYVQPDRYAASLRRLLDDVRPERLSLGHRFLEPTSGTLFEEQLEGNAVRDALRTSLNVEARLRSAAEQVLTASPAPSASEALALAAGMLGYHPDDPSTWPPSFHATLSGYLPADLVPREILGARSAQ